MSSPSGPKKKADLKIVILGDAAVGKTSFIYRYIEGTFQETISTIGASFFLKQWGPFNVAVWDTAGEEKFSGLSSFYCRGAGAAILAYDIANGKTFESLWSRFAPLLASADDTCLKVIIGTKLDLITPQNREVMQEDGRTLAEEINEKIPKNKLPRIPYFETSSLTGENVEDVFESILQYCLPLSDEERLKAKQKNRGTVDLSSPNMQQNKKCGC